MPAPAEDPPPRRIDANTWEDRRGRIYKLSDATRDITCVHDPVRDARVFTAAEFEKEPEPPRRDERSWKILDAVIQEFKAEKFICGPSGGSVGIVLLGGMERGLLELAANPDAVRAATAHLVRQQNLADAAFIHPDSDAVMWAEDLGYKTGPLIGPAMFRDFFLDANKERVRNVKGKFGKKILKHCCGNINMLMDFFVDIGFDAYQSIQPTAGMDICRLKKDYGDRIALWGGVAVENLVGGTPEDVRADVRRAMDCAKPGGRFILGASHSIAVGTKYDNFEAMLDEYAKLCQY
jgi:uroporphyrinogen decarboxylase